MIPVDPTPLGQVDTLDLMRELSDRLDERQVLGVRTRIARIEAELRARATAVNLTDTSDVFA